MKFGVISDTHGDEAAIRQAVALIGEVDGWLHAGDYSQDGAVLAALTGQKIIAVKGNCDGAASANINEFIDVDGKKIWLTHGHRYQVKQGIHELSWWARQYEADAVIYGHTHVSNIFWDKELLLFNPGSAACFNWNDNSACGILEVDSAGNIIPRILKIA
ncbi:MAG: metallophosphoesterase [Veillonellales bacterium]